MLAAADEGHAGRSVKPFMLSKGSNRDMDQAKRSHPEAWEDAQDAPRARSRTPARRGLSDEQEASMDKHILASKLEVIKSAISRVEQEMAEIIADREAAEEEAEKAKNECETVKETLAAFQSRLEEVLTGGLGIIGNAKAAINSVEAKVASVVPDAEKEAATVAAQIASWKKTLTGITEQLRSHEGGAGAVLLPVQEASPEKAEEAVVAAVTRRADLLDKRKSLLQTLSQQAGDVGEAAREVLLLEDMLESQGKMTAQLNLRCEHLGVDQDENLGVDQASLDKLKCKTNPVNQPQRLLVISSNMTEVAGEYKLLSKRVSSRPAYVLKPPNGATVFLFWCCSEGHSAWVFGHELYETMEVGKSDIAVPSIVARSLQVAWTALPHELATTRWKADQRVVNINVIAVATKDAGEP